ncbi:MAG: GDSL-type esterase/lipase family protein, partial [Candidatus Aminicenantes bacterium]|nr:GDSL-type esterase/lipase family protein [Candidatus Aminicenantes bacterium]
ELWRGWTEGSPSGESAWLARVNGEQPFQPFRLAEGPDLLYSLSFDFDLAGNPWVAWVAADDEASRVVARNIAGGTNEVLSPSAFVSVSSVRLAVDGRDRVWVVWSGRTSGRDEVFCRVFNGFAWEETERLSSDAGRPSLLPCVAAGPEGEPWVLWSTYDGNDYEIIGVRHTAGGWVKLPPLTDNRASDTFPDLTAGPDGRLTASWQMTTSSGPALKARTWTGHTWGHEVPASASAERTSRLPNPAPPAMRDLRSYLRRPLNDGASLPPVERDEPALPAVAADLADDRYICFGDSITYGVINHEYEPEKGYIPRLTVLVERFFGTSDFVNEGWPGETTINGLGRMDSVIARWRGRYLLLLDGTNDIIFNEISTDASTFNIEQMVRKCLQARVYPIIATILPRNDWRWETKFYRDRILNLNSNIAKIATNLHVGFVDMFTAFYTYPEGEGGYKGLLSDDKHPNEKGYELMSQYWFAELLRTPFCPVKEGAKRTVERSLFDDRVLNIISWRHNPKIFNPTENMTYTIYRRDASAARSAFQVLAKIPFSLFHTTQSYFDMTIVSSHRYEYAITLGRADGVEGPFSDLFND